MEDKKILRKPSDAEKTIRFMQYIRKHTDANHTMKLADIRQAFESMELKAGSPNTLHDFIINLADTLNMDQEQHSLPQSEWRITFDDYEKTYGDSENEKDYMQIRNLYYIPEFSYEEIDALIEAVRFSGTLTTKEADKLIETLQTQFTSKYYNQGAGRICKVHENIKYDKKQLRENLIMIQQAIEAGVQIEYQFNGYSYNKCIEPYGNYKRRVSPYYIVAYAGKYYLLGGNEKYKSSIILRVDLMSEVSILKGDKKNGTYGVKSLPKKEIEAMPEQWDPQYLQKHIDMSYDMPVKIKLRIRSEKVIGDLKRHQNPDYTFLYDKFGENYRYLGIDKDNPDYDIVTVQCSPFGMVHFALQYGDRVEVLEPVAVREQIAEKIRMLQNKYIKD